VPGCSAPAAAAAQAAKVAGWNFRVIDGQLSPAGVAAGIRQAIAAQPDAIMTNGLDCPQILQPLRDAQTAKIPVLILQASDCDQFSSGAGAGQAFSVPYQLNAVTATQSQFWAYYAQMQAQAIIQASGGKANLIAIDGRGAGGVGIEIYDAFSKEIAKCTGCKVTYVPFANDYSNNQLGNSITSALLKNPGADWVDLNIDAWASLGGGLKAVQQARSGGRTIHVVGGEGTDFGMQALRDGQVDFETAYSSEWVGWMGIDILNRHFANQPQVPEGWGVRLIDKSDLASQPKSGAYVPTDNYQAAYTKVWTGS
jgi:ribose transport system substrate-binding protein